MKDPVEKFNEKIDEIIKGKEGTRKHIVNCVIEEYSNLVVNLGVEEGPDEKVNLLLKAISDRFLQKDNLPKE